MSEAKCGCGKETALIRIGATGVTGMVENRPGEGTAVVQKKGPDGSLQSTTESITVYNIYFLALAPGAFGLATMIDGEWFIDSIDAVP